MKSLDVPNVHTSTGESILKTCFSSIAELTPLTSAIAKAYFQHMDEKRWKYVQDFFTDFIEILKEHEQKINELGDITDPEETLNLMLTAINKVQFEYQEAKRKKYAEIFVNSILIGSNINLDEKRMFIQLFSELSEADIELLGKFNSRSNFIIDLENFRKRGLPDGRSGLEEVVPLVSRLEARGLISEIPNAKRITQWDERPDSFDSIWRNKIYCLTPIGIKFCILLQGNE